MNAIIKTEPYEINFGFSDDGEKLNYKNAIKILSIYFKKRSK